MARNDRAKFWAFVGDNIVALSTVIAGVGVIIWQAIADPANPDPVLTAILGLLCLLATSEMVESRKRLDRIQSTVDRQVAQILTLLPVAEVRRFPDSESALTYLSRRAKDAGVSIDYASLDVVRSRVRSAHKKWLRDRNDLIEGGETRYRYLFRANAQRNVQVRKWLSNSVAGRFFTAGFSPRSLNAPMMVFVVLDNEEVFVRSPYEVGEDEVYMSIRHPDVVALFSQWFNRLWASATKIDPRLSYEQQVAELDRLLQTK